MVTLLLLMWNSESNGELRRQNVIVHAGAAGLMLERILNLELGLGSKPIGRGRVNPVKIRP